MSLYLGNLSSRIRRDDLERVFRRFGRNSVQLKDGYGFVVYDRPADAERALRALQGKNICGERISLTWSNKQPKPFRRFEAASRSYEPHNGRNFKRRENYATRGEASNDERGIKRVTREPDGQERGPHIHVCLDKDKDYACDDTAVDRVGDKCENVKNASVDDGLPIELGDNGRWGEPISGALDKKEVQSRADLNPYEPYHGYGRKDEDERHYRGSPHSSSARASSRDKSRKDVIDTRLRHVADTNYQQKCYVCGLTGHISCNCPQGNSFQQEKLTRLDRRRGSDVSFRVRHKRGLKRVTPSPWGRSYSTRSTPSSRCDKRERVLLGSEKPHRDETSPTTASESPKQKKRRIEDGNSKKCGNKSAKAGSSPQHSDSTASWLRSASSGSNSSAELKSRSVSSKTHSVPPSSRSMSASSKSRFQNPMSRSRSATPTSLSRSRSRSRPLRSSSNKADMEETVNSPKNHLEDDDGSASKKIVIDQRPMIGGYTNSGNTKLKSTIVDENVFSSIKVNDELVLNNHGQLDGDRHHELDRISSEIKDSCTNPLEKCSVSVDNYSSGNSGEGKDLQNSDPLEKEDTQVSDEKQNAEVPCTVQIKNSTSMSSQEMYMVLNHYGLAVPNENEENLSVEDYFGSARLWPWEIIYYRRLKKGAISTENYARRIAQNEEFGVVDKYVRSSSGWAEHKKSSV